MANPFDTSDMTVFFGDFASEFRAVTWGKTVNGIFDFDYVEFENVSREAPFFTVKESDVPRTATDGDLFVFDDVNYKLVDIQRSEPGVTRIIMAYA